MIKRMGFFTIFIIAGFFIFGSEVLGAGCDTLRVENVNSSNIRVFGSGFGEYGELTLVLYKNGQDESIQSARIIVKANGDIDLSVSFSQVSGNYTAVVANPVPMCSVSFTWLGTQDIPDGTVGEGGDCLEQKDCIAALLPLQCTERHQGSSEFICKQPSTTDTSQYLQEGAACQPNAVLIKDTCDNGKGLTCSRIEISPDGTSTYVPTYVYKCTQTSESIGETPVSIPFEAPALSIPGLIKEIIKFSVGVAGVVAFFLLAVGSYKFMLSSGDPKALQSAQETISSAIAGLVLIVLAVALFGIISGILQIPNIDFDGSGGVVTDTTNIPEQ